LALWSNGMSEFVSCPKCQGVGSEPQGNSPFSAPACIFCFGSGRVDRENTCSCGRYASILTKDNVPFCGRQACLVVGNAFKDWM